MTTNEKLRELVLRCLYRDGEVPSGSVPDGCVLVEGVMKKFAFHPDRIAAAREDILTFLRATLPDEFWCSRGGGWLFLNLFETRDGEHWGEHSDCDTLICLAMAIDAAKFCLPRDMWAAFPGGMPYVQFDLEA